ncbi:hypothetical protein FQZ97_958190 [compost metagenome]
MCTAEGDAIHLDAELASGETRQATPTAADIQQAFARLQTQLAAQMAHLGLLRLIQVFCASLEIGAGIDHLPVQPQRVEVIRDVVVVADGRSVGVFVVGAALHLGTAFIAEQCLAEGIADFYYRTHRSFQIQASLDIGTAQGVQARVGQLRHQARVLDHQGDPRLRTQVDLLAVP